MKGIHRAFFILFLSLLGCKKANSEDSKSDNSDVLVAPPTKPQVSFTFDDGKTSEEGGIPFEEWNQMILNHLEGENLKAVFFVAGRGKSDAKGQFLLKSWDQKGHTIANHTFSHPNFNALENRSQQLEKELIKTDEIIAKYENYGRLFRFPFLKEGKDGLKADSLRSILAKHGYTNGYVTIDASDWYVDQRLTRRIRKEGFEKTELEEYKSFYVQHILDRARFYEKLAYEMHGRHIPHTLLLHHNLTSALFLDDLMKAFKEEGWELVNTTEAFDDEVFQLIPAPEFAGESLIYSQAKESGNYGDLLRYPAEDSRYEKAAMDRLGL
jgi:peptidoglycan/xylan/chitin deacetylase (PgdA/CDA1 family)